ncbi:allantoicase [Williamsia sp. CHRR-6]|uniref:allantoicase n=1 Tax=Williamsia sp. CHRR-6 TaxID=2835871 RepID=UPI001BD929FC|nr:allantoicase [Williamsia sp. CHRR-6]MBT0566157.1 allantoicase [Williamsia sp. CHRR-6]
MTSPAPSPRPHFTAMPDLALRTLGGAVIWSNDDLFAEAQNLITAEPAEYRPATFGHKGQIYDGWETRRRREDGVDQAVIRLGVPGVVYGVVVDTAWFKGNYPPMISVEAAAVPGYPHADEVATSADWQTIVERSPVNGDTRNPFPVNTTERFTHVRLTMYPDGGVARLRVHGRGVPDPELLGHGPVDLAALENGGMITACSNMFYSSPNNLLMPGPPRTMGEGWETSRRRDAGNDWVQVRLAAEGVVRLVELDTTYFIGNAPGAARLQGRNGTDGEWIDLIARTALQPDTRHRLVVDDDAPAISEARLDIYPDGGMARLRMFGALTDAGRTDLTHRWESGEA